MKMPNTYGSVTKLPGKRRRPYAVRVTVGWHDDGRQIQKYVGYYEKKSDAMTALAEYNQKPFDLDNKKLTFDDIYERWAQKRWADKMIPYTYSSAYKHMSNLHKMPFLDIRKRHMQEEIDRCELGYGTKNMMKTLCNQLYKYALDMEIVPMNLATGLEIPKKTESHIHQPFSEEELEILWAHPEDEGARIALILSYTGMRPTELLRIRTEDVHLEERHMFGGMKTAAGKNRAIPIAEKIYPIILDMYDKENTHLVMDKRDKKPMLNHDRLRNHVWKVSKVLASLPHKHLPHDGRHTCATLMDNAGVPLKIMQLILGHADKSITHRVYTHKTIQQLVEAINRI